MPAKSALSRLADALGLRRGPAAQGAAQKAHLVLPYRCHSAAAAARGRR